MDAAPSAWRCEVAAVAPGRGLRVALARGGAAVDAFVVARGDRHRAFVNRCPHAGRALDREAGRFFTEDGCHLVCGEHGAIFDPDTGICVEGPCPGARLEALCVTRDRDDLVITWPS